MKTSKLSKIISVLLSVIMLASVFCCVASAETKELKLSGEGSYEIFNSGVTNSYPNGDVEFNTAVDTFDNDGYDIYLKYFDDYDDVLESQIGRSFTIESKVKDSAFLTVLAYDVDEGPSEDREHDYVYLVDETTGKETQVGMLSGMTDEWNTTSMQIDTKLLVKGHTYHFELVDSVWGWHVWVRTVTLVVGNAFDIKASLDSTIEDGMVKNKVKYSTSDPNKYTFEFKAISVEDGIQYGSYFEDVEIKRVAQRGEFEFELTEGAPDGEYEVYLYIKDVDTGAVVLVLQDNPSVDNNLNIFQKIWNFFLNIFACLGLS